MAIFGEVLFVEGEIVAPVLFFAFAADCFFLNFVTPSIISIIPIAHACTPRYHLMHMSMLGTFFTAAITFLFSWGFVLVRSSFASLSLTFFVVYNTCENTYGAHTHNHHYDHLVSILRGGSLRSRHSPSRIQHFGRELKNNIWSSKEPKRHDFYSSTSSPLHCQVTTYEEAWSNFDLLQPGQVSPRVPWSKGQGKKSQQCKPSIRHLLFVLEHGQGYKFAIQLQEDRP